MFLKHGLQARIKKVRMHERLRTKSYGNDITYLTISFTEVVFPLLSVTVRI